MGRALVLGGGGATGIAWEVGVLDGSGVDVGLADRVIGTSAGAVVAAKITAGFDRAALSAWASTPQVPRTGMTVAAVARLLLAQVRLDRSAALRDFGRRGLAAWTAAAQDEWINYVAGDLRGQAWPSRLVVTATNAVSGRGTVFDATSGVDLGLAVAASCAVPGIVPPVMLDGVPYMDGGLRSPANVDLAWGFDPVLVVTSDTASARPYRRPNWQAARLGSRVCLVGPDLRTRLCQGPDMLNTRQVADIYAEGVRQGRVNVSW